jgi:methylenetetrahydrofolate dehydrogenase (NADP+)/methenyltetrahydrofolate cyclohydrolase
MMATTQKAKLIDGRSLAAEVRNELKTRVDALGHRGKHVRLDAILVGGDGAAEVYVRNQRGLCQDLGIEHLLHRVGADASFDEVADCIGMLSDNDAVNAIMLHLPLPNQIETERVQSLIAVDKDVEGVNPANIGNVVYGRRSLVPCTSLAVMEMIESTGVELPGARCLCVGASNIVGKPVAVLLMRAEATVISTNVHTRDLSDLSRTADVLVSAAGVPGLITADMVKPGAVVIDVGINRLRQADGSMRLVGDVDFETVSEIAGHISPVPGGVGPMTVAMLMRNTVDAAER